MMKWALLLPVLLRSAYPQDVQYTLSFPNAVHHEAEVEARFTGAPAAVEFRMSRSSPGRYALHDFARNVYNVRITDGHGRPLPFARPNAAQWNVTGHNGTVVVRYTLFGDYPNGTYNAIDASRAVLNAPATFLWARGFTNRPASVTIAPPANSGWKVATQLQAASEFVYRAPNMDYLLDSPILAGNVRLHEWAHGKQRMRIALHQGSEAEASGMGRVMEVAASELEGVFGELPDFDFGTYTFLLHHTTGSMYDAMEHRNSTMVTSPRAIKEFRGDAATHEFIHAWNIERIRPASLEPFNYEDTNTSQELWFGEGFTNYYDPLVSRRAGLISIDRLCEALAGAINSVQLGPGRDVFSAAEMSQLASFTDGAFRPTNSTAAGGFDNFRNTYISHYPHGMALALGIDFRIRTEFPGKSLDDWMRAMWTQFGRLQRNYAPAKPYTLAGLEQTLASVTSSEFASRIFDDHIRGRKALDFGPLLARAGLLLRRSAPDKVRFDTNVELVDNTMVVAQATLRGGALYEAGIDRGDRINEVEGVRFGKIEVLNEWLAKKKPGERVKMKVTTATGDREVEITLPADPRTEVVTFEKAGRALSPEQSAFRQSWLASKAKAGGESLRRYCPQCRRGHPFEYETCPFDGKTLELLPPSSSLESSQPATR